METHVSIATDEQVVAEGFDDPATTAAHNQAHALDRTMSAELNIIGAAWVTAFLLPIVGFALGVILTSRQREGHGIWTMILSTLMVGVWYILISAFNSLPRYRY